MNYEGALAWGRERLQDAGVDSPAVDVRRIAEHLGMERFGMERFSAENGEVDVPLLDTFRALVERRCTREPLQHITGTMPFRFLELSAKPGTFIVRPETEWMVDSALAEARRTPNARIVDLCTGSGAIAIALATEVPDSEVWAVELSDSAYRLACENNARYGSRVHMVHGDARTAVLELEGTIDIVISNPPYIPAGDGTSVEACHDPQIALWGGGADGLDMPRVIIRRAAALLKEGGLLVMEHAESQSEAVREYACECGFVQAETGTDATGRERWLTARLGNKSVHEQAHDTAPSFITLDDSVSQAEAIRHACTYIARGELIVMPTDTVYGVAASAFSASAVQRLLDAKERGRSKPSPVLVSSWADVERLAVCDERARALGRAFLPGALTLILPLRSDSGIDVGETGGTIALRIPAHDFARELLAATGPLAVSSANKTDMPPARTARHARDMLGSDVALYIEAGQVSDSAPSTIVSLCGDTVIVRQGAVSETDIYAVLEEVK